MTTTAPPDYSLIDPGIRRLVRWLRSRGYETTASSDGSREDGHCGFDVPYVFIHIPRATDIVRRSDDLLADLATIGVRVEPMREEPDRVAIQATYDPADGSVIIALFGVRDVDMPPLAN